MAPLSTLTALSETWDETTIRGTDYANTLDTNIQEFKRAIRERFAVDHEMVTTEAGVNNLGAHKVVHLLVQAAHPSALVNAGCLYTYDVAGKAELFWKDEDENEVQLTAAGVINCNAVLLTGDQTVDGIKNFLKLPTVPTDDPVNDNQLTSKKYVDSKNANNNAGATGTSDINTSSASYVDMADMSINFIASGGRSVLMLFSATFYCATDTAYTSVAIVVDGVAEAFSLGTPVSHSYLSWFPIPVICRKVLSAGAHTIKVQWKTSSTTVQQRGTTDGARQLVVVEL